jgi:CubicO group peptidase (beta-lactamase class C family)
VFALDRHRQLLQLHTAFKFAIAMQLKALLSLVPFYLATFAVAGPVKSSNSTAAAGQVLDAETDAFINNMLKEWNSPGGISVSFVRKDADGNWQTEVKGYGVANGNGDKVNENTYFNIASNTKVCLNSSPLLFLFLMAFCSACYSHVDRPLN